MPYLFWEKEGDMEPRELFGEAEKKRMIEDACRKLRGGEKEKCVRIFKERVDKEQEKQIADEKK